MQKQRHQPNVRDKNRIDDDMPTKIQDRHRTDLARLFLTHLLQLYVK